MNLKINIQKKDDLINCMLIILLLYSGSMAVIENYSGSIQIILIIVISLLIALNNKGRIKKGIFLVFILQMTLILISMLINGVLFSLDIGLIVTLGSALMISSSLKYSDFVNLYCKVLLFLSVGSLIVYLSYLIIPNIWDFIPTQLWRNGTASFKNVLISVIPVSMTDYYRNFGIFYEPGIFQIYINIALFFELFVKKTPGRNAVIIYIFTIITTVSTNGYITTLMLVFAYVFKKNKIKNIQKIKFILVSILIILITTFLIQKGYISTRVFTKFDNITEVGSGYERLRAFYFSLEKFLENPLFGISHVNIINGFIVTFTPINWFMLYGFLYGILTNFGFLINLYFMNEKYSVKFALTIAMLSMIISQDMSSDPIIYIYIYYNYVNFFSMERAIMVKNIH